VEIDTSFASGNWQKVIRQLVADELHMPPDVFDPALDEVDFGGEQPAAA
jgi:hypothetical protein